MNFFQNKSNEVKEMNVINIISKGTSIQGNITCKGDIRIDGILLGNVTTDGKLVSGEGSDIQGDIKVSSAKIGGIVKGNIYASGVLEVEKTSRIEGQISSNGLIVHEGADLRAEISSKNKSISNNSNPSVNKAEPKFSRAAVL